MILCLGAKRGSISISSPSQLTTFPMLPRAGGRLVTGISFRPMMLGGSRLAGHLARLLNPTSRASKSVRDTMAIFLSLTHWTWCLAIFALMCSLMRSHTGPAKPLDTMRTGTSSPIQDMTQHSRQSRRF
jgi:hypothetical protein